MASGGSDQTSFELNGQTYRSLAEVPQPFRDSIAALMVDHDGNAIPDVFEGDAEHLQVVHRSFEIFEVDGIQYSSIDDVPEPHRTTLRKALDRAGSSPADDETGLRIERPLSNAPIAPNPIITPAGRSRRWKLLASLMAIDAIAVLLVIWLLTR